MKKEMVFKYIPTSYHNKLLLNLYIYSGRCETELMMVVLVWVMMSITELKCLLEEKTTYIQPWLVFSYTCFWGWIGVGVSFVFYITL